MKAIFGRLWIWILALAVAAMTVTRLVAFAQVWTDQPDYSPGSIVTLNGDNSDGAGYLAGETVHVLVGIPDSFTTSCDAIADASGGWSCQVTLPLNTDAIGLNAYTATGQTSGVSQAGSFTDSGCKNSNAINTVLTASNVGASFTASGNVATYSFQSFTNENPLGGVPGLIEYCVYTSPLPNSTTAVAIGANATAFVSSTDASKGEFAFQRNGGDPANLPFDGTTHTVGTATFNTGVPTLQTIVLHINDAAECKRVYGVGSTNVVSDTCFVLPGTAQAKLTLVKNVNHSGTSDTTAATAWTLSASGPTPLSGAGGATGTVSPGLYTLTESPSVLAGWTSSGFDCGAGGVTTVTLTLGDNTTCTITNTAARQSVVEGK